MQGLNNGLSVSEVANEIRAWRHSNKVSDSNIKGGDKFNSQQSARREVEYIKDLESMLYEDYKRYSV